MNTTARAALLWTKWVGGAAVVLAALALLLLRDRPAHVAGGVDHTPVTPAAGGQTAIVSRTRTKHASSSTVPRFQLPAPVKPGERHFQAMLAKQRARARGERIPGTPGLFEGEARDPVWAPAMERALDDHLLRAREVVAKAGLKETRIHAPECRTSTCRVELDYTDRDVASARKAGTLGADELPYGLIVDETGFLAQLTSDLRPEPIEVVDGVTRFKKVVYLVLGAEESDPGSYAAWVAKAQRERAEYLKIAGPR
jgi:hypothetical protein